MSDQHGFYSVIDYSVDSAHTQQEYVRAFEELAREWVSHWPGFLSARFLASEDGRRVFNIVHWESEEAFRAFERDSDTDGRVAAIQRAADGVEGHLELRMTESPRYRTAAVVEPQGARD